MRRAIIPALLATTLAITACSGTDDGPGAGGATASGSDAAGESTGNGSDNAGADGPVRRARLLQFDECDALLEHVRSVALEHVGPWGFGQGGYFGPVDGVVEEADEAAEEPAEEPAEGPSDAVASDGSASFDIPASAAPALPTTGGGDDSADGDVAFSDTNVQVIGVDEPDIIKTDGSRVLAVRNNRLFAATVSDGGATAELRSSLRIDPDVGPYDSFWGQELVFDGDRAFIIARGDSWSGDVFESTLPVEPDAPIGGPIGPGFGYIGPTTYVYEIDLSDLDAIRTVSRVALGGRYVGARKVGSEMRIAVSSVPDLGFVAPSSNTARARQTALETNRRVIAESTADQWLPTLSITAGAAGDADDGESARLVECGDVFAPEQFSGFNMLTVANFATDRGLGEPTSSAAVLASGDTLYATPQRVYVATTQWLPPTADEAARGVWSDQYRTDVHRFDVGDDGALGYVASGGVEGTLLNQFAMHDHADTLFVATTEGSPWNRGSESQVVALQVDGNDLVEVGRAGDLGIDERIYAVRYLGDTAYVVTFREVDPLYVIDLSDPTALVVRGELKIPGFSSYLHPIGDGLLIGVGQEASPEGWTTGTKLSLFDVGDPTNPTELDAWSMPGSDTGFNFDHRAFLWWPERSLAVVPVAGRTASTTGAALLRVTREGIEELGMVSHSASESDGSCDSLTGDDVLELTGGQENELFWMAQEAGVQLCRPAANGESPNYECEVWPIDEAGWLLGTEDGAPPAAWSEYDRIELCWGGSWHLRVERSLIIGDTLWTLSAEQFAGHDLDSLTPTSSLTFQ